MNGAAGASNIPRSGSVSLFQQIATRVAVGAASTPRSARGERVHASGGVSNEDLELPRRQRPRGGVLVDRPGRQKQGLLQS
jgi:hypothetical protein